MITLYDFARWFHVLIMGYWLGSEFVINAWSWHFARAAHLPYGERMKLWDMVIDTDQHVRNALILIMPFGFMLAAQLGVVNLSGSELVAIWVFDLIWFALMWQSHLTLKSPHGKFWRDLDYWLRIAVAVVFIALGLVSLVGHAPVSANWLALKLVIYGLIIFCGVGIRIFVRQVYAALPDYARTGTSTPEIEREILAGIKGATWVIVVLWGLAFAAGYLGAAKPL